MKNKKPYVTHLLHLRPPLDVKEGGLSVVREFSFPILVTQSWRWPTSSRYYSLLFFYSFSLFFFLSCPKFWVGQSFLSAPENWSWGETPASKRQTSSVPKRELKRRGKKEKEKNKIIIWRWSFNVSEVQRVQSVNMLSFCQNEGLRGSMEMLRHRHVEDPPRGPTKWLRSAGKRFCQAPGSLRSDLYSLRTSHYVIMHNKKSAQTIIYFFWWQHRNIYEGCWESLVRFLSLQKYPSTKWKTTSVWLCSRCLHLVTSFQPNSLQVDSGFCEGGDHYWGSRWAHSQFEAWTIWTVS